MLTLHVKAIGLLSSLTRCALLAVCCFTLGLAACASRPPKTNSAMNNVDDPIDCASPARPSFSLVVKNMRAWRYGCFCGQDYPHFSPRNPPSLDPKSDQDDLVAKYLTRQPIDSVDRACQEHDVCYIRHPEDWSTCNKILILQAQVMYSQFRAQRTALATDTTAFRCGVLVSDIQAGFLSAGVTERSIAPGERVGMRFGEWFNTAILGPPTLLIRTLTGSGSKAYPHEDERCNLHPAG